MNSINTESKSLGLPDSLFAHSLHDEAIEKWQKLDSHLFEVAKLAAQFADLFYSGDWAWNAGLLHDIGKGSYEFQAYIRKENHIDDPEYDSVQYGKVNHSSAGAVFAEEIFNQDNLLYGRVLSYLISGHHAGLPDFYNDQIGRVALVSRLSEGHLDADKVRNCLDFIYNKSKPLNALPQFVKSENFHSWVRMLFSCLIDADSLNTEEFVSPHIAKHRKGKAAIPELKSALDVYMNDLVMTCKKTKINLSRSNILSYCRDAAELEPGLFTLTVPTGGGKTLSAMSFALDHAVKYGKDRVIYVIPFTSIIEQTAEVLSKVLDSDSIIEHHSNLDPKKESLRSRLASENWDAPVIVTTNVQFFESLYSARRNRCRKLHNIVNSVVILDEAQMVPPELLSPCVEVLNELTSNYSTTCVLSTATQPVLPNLNVAREIVPSNATLYQNLQRTNIILPNDLNSRQSWADISNKLCEHEQVLCIVNTRKDCYSLFHLMPENTVYLSASMCGQHRSNAIKRVKKCLQKHEPIAVISTQLVEAGVDIDFPVVYRALSGIPSITQAAGRCNREGSLSTTGNVYIFVPPRPSPTGLLRKGEDTTIEMNSMQELDFNSPEIFVHYFELFYSKVNETGKEILDKLTPSEKLDVYFRSVGDNFHLIKDEYQIPVFVRYNNGSALIHELQDSGPTRLLLRKLQRYTVNIPTNTADKMIINGLLEEVWPGYIAQKSPTIYSDEIGLDIFSSSA